MYELELVSKVLSVLDIPFKREGDQFNIGENINSIKLRQLTQFIDYNLIISNNQIYLTHVRKRSNNK